jgi:hypothetical protein
MRGDTFTCPACGVELRRPPGLGAGSTVMCPRCGGSFACPAAEEVPADIRGGAPLATSTAFTATPVEAARPVIEEEDEDHPQALGRIDFDLTLARPLNLAECFRFACEHWGSIVRPYACFSLVYLLVAFILTVPCIGFLIAFFLVPPLHAGLSVVAIAQLKGREWWETDFAGGFFSGRSVVGLAFCALLLGGLLFPAVMGLQGSLTGFTVPPYPWGKILSTSLVGTPLFIWLYVRLFTFSLPLVLERNFTATEALALSWELTEERFWPLLGMHLALTLINIAGALCFGVGLLATLPFTALVRNAAYLQVAGVEPPRSPTPPSRAGEERYDAF